MKNFKTYQIAVDFYRLLAPEQLPGHLKDQLNRASSSIALNLAEGAGRFNKKDQRRFYKIAYGSLRECKAIIEIGEIRDSKIESCADKLGAHLYKLIKS